jgi:cation:H+ antiporter
MTIVELVLSIVGILIAAYLFTNSIEIFGDRIGWGQGAVGSVLAAVPCSSVRIPPRAAR